MKKTVLFILSIFMCGILLAGCKNKTQGNFGVNENLVESGETTSMNETLDEQTSEKETETERITVPVEKSTTVEPTVSPTTVATTQPVTATPTKPAPAKTYTLKKN